MSYRRRFMLFPLVMAVLPASAQRVTWNKSYADYFEQYAELAVQQMHQYHIPASITLAQGVLESGAGKSELARKANNHFGIKCHGWKGRTSYHDDDAKGECFRAYDNVFQSYVDHSEFLRGSTRYQSLFQLKPTDYQGWAKGLKACGYATSPTYASQLIAIIECYQLHEYDRAKSLGRFRTQQLQQGDLRQIFAFNKNYFVIAKQGDTFATIAADVNMPSRRLAAINELDHDALLAEGDYVWLKRKRSNAPAEYKGKIHRVVEGESMYSISQRYGIRLKSLYKMNHLAPDYVISVGDMLRVR